MTITNPSPLEAEQPAEAEAAEPPPLVLVQLVLGLPQYHARLPCPRCRTVTRFESGDNPYYAGRPFRCRLLSCGAILGRYLLDDLGRTMVQVLSRALDAGTTLP